MEVTNCKDINGNDITEITLNTDGTVLAVLEVNGVSSTSKLSSECCTNNGYAFDPKDAKCYWSSSCDTGGSYKIILDPEGNSGAYFQVDDNQKGYCRLEIELDYLLKFNCETLAESLGIQNSFQLELSLEKVVYDESLPIPNNLVSVQKEDIVNVNNGILGFLSGSTGIIVEGEACQTKITNFVNSLPLTSQSLITNTTFNSDWVKYKMVIDDPAILESIYNEYVKIVIIGHNLMDFSILVDNIKLNKICETETGEVFLKDECPSFNLKRVIDNKKSWVGLETPELREFDLSRRSTSYNINNERLSINTKEIDLLINPSNAVENDVFEFTKDYPCILNPATGCTSGNTTHNCIDISELITIPIEEITDGIELLNQLIDVKTRKTLNSYPVIELLYYRYINSEAHCGIKSNALSEDSVEKFVDLVASFWSEIIEQVVPATTIWGSSYQHSNTVFGAGKFKYRRSTLQLCNSLDFDAPSPTRGINTNVDVITVDVTDTEYFGPLEFAPSNSTQECSGVYITQTNDGSEFLGTVTVIGNGGDTTSGDTITINETITDYCNIYNKLEGDFNPLDYNNNDWDTPNKP